MNLDSFLYLTDRLSLAHFQGGKVADCHGGSSAVNLVSIFGKLFRLKMAENRGRYGSPFQSSFGNEFGSDNPNFNDSLLRVGVGDIESDKTHYTFESLKRLFENFQMTERQYTIDSMDHEGNLTFQKNVH